MCPHPSIRIRAAFAFIIRRCSSVFASAPPLPDASNSGLASAAVRVRSVHGSTASFVGARTAVVGALVAGVPRRFAALACPSAAVRRSCSSLVADDVPGFTSSPSEARLALAATSVLVTAGCRVVVSVGVFVALLARGGSAMSVRGHGAPPLVGVSVLHTGPFFPVDVPPLSAVARLFVRRGAVAQPAGLAPVLACL